MKSRIILFAVTILIASSFSNLSAQNKNEGITNITKFQQVKISYDMKDMLTLEYLDALSEGPWKMKVRVYEESGKLLYSRMLRKKGNSRIGYDISQLPTGKYTIELYKNRQLVCSKAIEKGLSIANVNEGSDEKTDVSKFNQVQISYKNNEMVHLEYLDVFNEGRRKMEVRIYEESGELLYSKLLSRNGDVNIDFDISQFPSGKYNFELYKDKEQVCSELIVKHAHNANASKEPNLLAKENSSK